MEQDSNLRIVREERGGCIDRISNLAALNVYYVVSEPIFETGICVQFATEEQAKAYVKALKKNINDLKGVTT